MSLQALCELGQTQLMRTEYLQAEQTFLQAEAIAWDTRDWDTLSRLYMPLQEIRRQRRLRCGEGTVQLDLLATSPHDQPVADDVARAFPMGQFLIAGWGSIAPALALRSIQQQRQLYIETLLAAVFPVTDGRAVVIVPTADVPLPAPEPRSIDQLRAALPTGCIVLSPDELPTGHQSGSPETFGYVSGLWEKLHYPWLCDADSEPDLLARVTKYRKTIEVDYACELAHQRLSFTARDLARG